LDEYVCVTVRSRANEPADEFNKRLIAFWSGMLRGRKDQYDRVHAETSRFGSANDQLTRQYLVGADVADVLADELSSAEIDHEPIDAADLYSKYEATPPEWFQSPH
jgi:hypothetical protein